MKKESVKPMGENVLVMPLKIEQKTASGIFLPDGANTEKPQEGKVLAIGDSDKIKVKKGQTVIFAKYSGTEIRINKDDCLIIKAEDILATIE